LFEKNHEGSDMTQEHTIPIVNKPMKNANMLRTATTIYCSVSKAWIAENRQFLPTWDGNDLLSFACAQCHTIAKVLRLDFFPKTVPTLRISLMCPNCKGTGTRKIFTEPPKNTTFMQTLTDKNELLHYYKSHDKPEKTLQLKGER
jgi:hypothetical protein